MIINTPIILMSDGADVPNKAMPPKMANSTSLACVASMAAICALVVALERANRKILVAITPANNATKNVLNT